jgi:hypothetical protein
VSVVTLSDSDAEVTLTSGNCREALKYRKNRHSSGTWVEVIPGRLQTARSEVQILPFPLKEQVRPFDARLEAGEAVQLPQVMYRINGRVEVTERSLWTGSSVVECPRTQMDCRATGCNAHTGSTTQ